MLFGDITTVRGRAVDDPVWRGAISGAPLSLLLSFPLWPRRTRDEAADWSWGPLR